MNSKFRVGLFTSAWDKVAWELVYEVHRAIQSGRIPDAETAILLSTREAGETHFGDLMIQNAEKEKLPIVTFSSLRFKPNLRKQGRKAKQEGDPSILGAWRVEHDLEIAKRIPRTDLDVLLGYMWEFSPDICRKRKIINLHPALPSEPKGTYKEVIWELIRSRAVETGVMIHLVSENLDRGPTVSFCRFSIRGGAFDPLWEEMDKRLRHESLESIIVREGESNPLFELIRREGVKREFPVVIGAIRKLAEGKVRIENGIIVDSSGEAVTDGYDLTREIELIITNEARRE